MEENIPRGAYNAGHCLVSAHVTQKCSKVARVSPHQSMVTLCQGRSRRHQGLETGSNVRHRQGFIGQLLSANIWNLCCCTPQRSAWMLLASLPKFHFRPAILRGFRRPFVSSCHSPCKLPIWPWQRTGRSNPVVLTARLRLFSETFASVQVAFLCLIS